MKEKKNRGNQIGYQDEQEDAGDRTRKYGGTNTCGNGQFGAHTDHRGRKVEKKRERN